MRGRTPVGTPADVPLPASRGPPARWRASTAVRRRPRACRRAHHRGTKRWHASRGRHRGRRYPHEENHDHGPAPPGGESGNRERVPAGAGRGGADGGRRGGPGTGGGRAAATARRAGGREGRHGRGGRTDRVRLPGGVPVAARGRRGRTAAARGRGDRRRQDQHVRAGTVAVHGGAGLRGHPESLAPGPTPPAVPRVVRRQPWPPGSCRPPWARTAPGRCASPPPGRTSSASSHSAAASRPDRTRSPSRASPSTAPSPARSPTPPASWTRPAETTRATCTGRPPSTPPRPSEESRGGSESPCP